MNFLIEDLKKANKFLEYVEDVKNKYSPIILSGLSSVGKIHLVEATREYTNKNICLVTYNELQARKIVQDLKYFSSNVFYFPKREIASYDYVAESKDLPYERIETLNKIFEQDKNNKSAKIIVVTTIEAIMQKMITKKDIYQNILEFKLGKSLNLDKLKQDLIHLGYERSDIVDGKGQFSVRGGILDIGTTKTQGIRIEFWGDEVDSIRSFSITSQRTNKMLEEARIYPSHELIVTKNLEKICEEIMAKEKNEDVLDDVELIKSGNYISKIDKYFDSFYDEKCSFLDYFDENYLLCIDDIDKINARQENIIKDNNQLIETLIQKRRAVPNAISNISKVNLEEKEGTAIYLYESDLLQNSKPVKFSKNVFNFKYRDFHFFKSELNILAQDIKKEIY